MALKETRDVEAPLSSGARCGERLVVPMAILGDMAKVMVSMPDALLERIDREAARQETTRSGFLQESAMRALGKPDTRRSEAALARMRARAARYGGLDMDAAQAIRTDRDWRDARDAARPEARPPPAYPDSTGPGRDEG